MFLFLAIAVHSVMAANVPRNFRVRLERDVDSILRIRGNLMLDNVVGASTIRPRVMMDECGGLPDWLWVEGALFVVDEDGIASGNRQAFIDVSDMVSTVAGTGTMMAFSLIYHATMTRNVDSIIYLHSTDGSESLIMNPTDVTQFAYSESISYAHMQRGSFVYARTRCSTMNEIDTQMAPLSIRLNDQDGSKVSADTFAFLTLAIRSHGAQLREASLGRWEIHLENCYDRLIPVLPDLSYILSSDRRSTSNGFQIVLRPNDYLRRSDDSRVCNLDVDIDRDGMSLSLSDRLLRQIGGIHLDYINSRIGFFDPL
jgi:hypothetical protein